MKDTLPAAQSQSSPTRQENLAAALALASKGYPVHPLRGEAEILTNGQHRGPGTPYLSGFPSKATTDLNRIKRLWKKFPDAVPGVAAF